MLRRTGTLLFLMYWILTLFAGCYDAPEASTQASVLSTSAISRPSVSTPSTTQPVTVPATQPEKPPKVICIDAGHQQSAIWDTEPNGPGSDVMKAKLSSGTQGVATRIPEYQLNLDVSLLLEEELLVRGYEVVMIRSTVGLLVRKLAHFSEYALLGFSLMLHITQVQKKITVCLPWLWAWGIGTLYAATDEFHQGFVAGRGPSVVDVTIDSAGVITGIVLLLWILLRKKKDNSIFPEC